MSARKERRYQAEDLEDMLKADLVNIIKGQISKWPGGNFNHSKLTKAKLEAAILENEFTLMEAAPVEEVPPSQIEENAHLETTPTPALRSLDLWIEDMRVQPSNKFIQCVMVVSAGELETGEWVVDGKAILAALQESPSALNGPVKLAFEDQKDDGWKRYFARTSGSELLSNATTSPLQLIVPQSSTFRFSVEHSELFLSAPKREQSDADVTASGSSSAVSPIKAQTKRSSRADPDEVSSLKEILAARSGYNEFRDNQGKRLSNKDRVVFWKFASDFSSEFHKNSAASTSSAKSVKKASIESALGMGTTALAEAEKMSKILEKYGDSGKNRAQDIVDRTSSDTFEGCAFSDFLASWGKPNSS
ncbi:hypothetical protein K438DRAFT_1974854 [Mycena galopus ATCC 62051]|nr:hypothetical protein K438DRAFT_1974854 [Mycena galopus ATCC 62051]